MFEWANGGNLRNLWERVPFPDLEGSLVKDTVKQILGLASALRAAHNLNITEASYRHGDLKPENILIFKTGEETLGTLKIGDWGEAKYHGKDQVTEMRSKKTTARFGTRRYEAPEVVTGIKVERENQPEKRRSRLYDIWAMGCITLEFIVWLLYGLDGLNKFNQDVDGDTFYQTSIENGIEVARLHDAVVRWMDHMASEPACKVGNTAIGDLLDVVRSSLLVVKLPRRGGLTFMTAINEADETAEADRPRVRSLIDHEAGRPVRSDLNSEMDSLAVSDTRPPGVVPAFVVTGAEEDTEDSMQDIQPVQPLPELSGPGRCLASTFSDEVDHIWCEDDIVGYWDTHTHHLRVPVSLASSSALQVVDNRSKTAEADRPRARSLIASEYLRAKLRKLARSNTSMRGTEIDYDVLFTKPLMSAVQDRCKRAVEHAAGTKLSWWPLTEPEQELRPNYTRIYSQPHIGSSRVTACFHDDIPTSLAEKLFANLTTTRDITQNWSWLSRWKANDPKAVLLRGTTLMRVLYEASGEFVILSGFCRRLTSY